MDQLGEGSNRIESGEREETNFRVGPFVLFLATRQSNLYK